MPSILFILLLALVIFGPRKLLHVATNMVPTQHPWEKLMSLMTGSADADTQEAGSLRESNTESPERLAAPSEPLASLSARGESE
jgi:Sec-independent protein translocase protein TatA